MLGKLIILYGINNLGKSTQAKLLVKRLVDEGQMAEYLKYPLYDLAPSGPLINEYLRLGNPKNLSAREIQLLYILNRTQYQSVLTEKLSQGITIVAEDYVGTGIAWGVGAGVDEEFLKTANAHLIREDLAFLFYGERFAAATETGHKHETNDALLQTVAQIHTKLGAEYGWLKILANQTIEAIHNELWQSVSALLKL